MSPENLHVELTSRCTLKCPACPRTTWAELLKMPVQKTDLDIDAFSKFIDCPAGDAIKTLWLCGDYGDCIYYPDLIKFVNRFRHKQFSIYTNGSYQTKEFWHQLADAVTENDVVRFCIDGLEDTNHLYRKNSNWHSIMNGLEIMSKSPAKIYWRTIVFSFNYKILNEISQFAASKGAEFECIKTHRYGDDSLIPPAEFVEEQYIFKKEYNTDHSIIIEPKCNTKHVVTSDGILMPCDWMRNPQTLYKSELWKQKSRWIDKLDISKTNYSAALGVVADWAAFVKQNSINGSPLVDNLCKMKCRAGCNQESLVRIP